MKRDFDIASFLKPLASAPLQAYLSNAVQVADIMEWVVAQIGECEIWQSSFSISEEYLRRLFFMKNKNLIKKITLVLDHKATNMTIKLWVFINELVKDCFLADNHSKIILFKSVSGRCVSVVTSQNLTRGNRNESAVVTTDEVIFHNLLGSLNDLIQNYSVPFSELMEQAVNFDLNELS